MLNELCTKLCMVPVMMAGFRRKGKREPKDKVSTTEEVDRRCTVEQQ
jgi:hypothetical protein